MVREIRTLRAKRRKQDRILSSEGYCTNLRASLRAIENRELVTERKGSECAYCLEQVFDSGSCAHPRACKAHVILYVLVVAANCCWVQGFPQP